MFNRVYLIIFLTLFSCAEKIRYEPPAELLPYVEKFESYYRVDVRNIQMKYEKLNNYTRLGVCTNYPGMPIYNKISINSETWEYQNDLEKEMTIFHELGHCFFLRDHDDMILPSGIKKSIMHSFQYTGDDEDYRVNQEYYLQELWEGRNFP